MGDDDGNANDSDTSANALEEISDGIILTPQALQFQEIAKSMGIKFAVDANEANAYGRRDSDYDEEDSDDLEECAESCSASALREDNEPSRGHANKIVENTYFLRKKKIKPKKRPRVNLNRGRIYVLQASQEKTTTPSRGHAKQNYREHELSSEEAILNASQIDPDILVFCRILWSYFGFWEMLDFMGF